MYKYTIKRILLMVPTLVGAAILVFGLLRLIPGDVCELRMAGEGSFVDPEAIKACQADLGMDQPMLIQFWDFIFGFFTFNLGTGSGYSVLDMVKAMGKACGHEIKYKIDVQ